MISRTRGKCLSLSRVGTLLSTTNVSHGHGTRIHARRSTMHITGRVNFPLMVGMYNPMRGSSMNNIMLGVGSVRAIGTRFSHLVIVPRACTIRVYPVCGKARVFVNTDHRTGFKRRMLYNLKNVFVRMLGSMRTSLTPVSMPRTRSVVRHLHDCGVVRNIHNRRPIGRRLFTRTVSHVSTLIRTTPRVTRVSLGPLLKDTGHMITISTHVHVRGWAVTVACVGASLFPSAEANLFLFLPGCRVGLHRDVG